MTGTTRNGHGSEPQHPHPRSTRGGGAVPRSAPVGWVYLEDGFTIRWRRGDTVAYVFNGEQRGADPATTPVVATIPVTKKGWTDHTQIRSVGERWVREKAGSPGVPTLADRLRAMLSHSSPTNEQIRQIVTRSTSP